MQGLTIYRSSAGSGKTYTLVKDYLTIALQFPFQFRRILAITFTNKATAEMKNRIMSALIELSAGHASDLKKELEERLPQTDIQQRSREVLQNILHHYSNFSISTIDSFFNEIVKSLAHELRLSLRFEIELDQDHLLNEACSRLLQYAGKDKALTKWLIDFLKYKLDHDKGWNIRLQLIKTGRRLFDENAENDALEFNEEQYRKITEELRIIRRNFERRMTEYSKSFFRILEENGYTQDILAGGARGVSSYFRKIGNADDAKDYALSATAVNTVNDSGKWLSKEKRSDSNLVVLCQQQLHPLLEEVTAHVNSNYLLYNSAVESLKTIYVRGILSRLNDEVKNYRDEHNVITLSDANKIVRSSVTASDTPLIYEKTGNYYQHYLIDEFQDTSTVQWENIHPLITEALSGNKSALLVGDVKQSIYRWRGGNMDLLHRKAEDHFRSISKTHSVVLGVNYRSSKEIIHFNNEFFHAAGGIVQAMSGVSLPIISEAYSESQLKQHSPPNAPPGGFVRVSVIPKTIQGGTEESWKQRSLQLMLKQIADLLQNGFRYGDLAVLVRNNEEGNDVALFLYRNGIKEIVSADSLLINRASQVIFIINSMRLLMDPGNTLIRKEMSWYLYRKSSGNEENLHDIFYRKSATGENERKIEEFISKYNSVPLASVDKLVSSAILFFELNREADAFIQRLQDLVFEYTDKHTGDVYSFMQWWDNEKAGKSASVIMPPGGNAIQIMTIHKSKGLQFPVVLLPFADWDMKPKSGEILWAEGTETAPFNAFKEWPLEAGSNLQNTVFAKTWLRSLEDHYIDNLNLLYVAFTRAVNHLYITACNKKSKGNSISDLILQTLDQLPFLQQDNNGLFSFGTLVMQTADERIKQPSYFNPAVIGLIEYPVCEWQDRIKIRTEKNYRSKEIESGLILHNALYHIITEADAGRAIYKTSAQFHLTEAETESLKTDVFKILDLCRDRKWFSGDYAAKNETEFVTPEGKLYRADRVMIRNREAIVIDYKTGEESATHHRQAAEYSSLLKACGYTTVECWIVYTTAGTIIRVNEDVQQPAE